MIRLRIHRLIGVTLLAIAAVRPTYAAAEVRLPTALPGYAPLDQRGPSGEPWQPPLRYSLAPRLDVTLSHGKSGERPTPKSRLVEPAFAPARPAGSIRVRLAFKW